MASTIKLRDTADFAQAFMPFGQVNVGGWGYQPALTCANTILQTICGAPFAWPWNRATVQVNTASGVHDYTQMVSDFGFIETATFNGYEVTQIRNCLGVGATSETGQVGYIAVQNMDSSGNVTFRLSPAPDDVWQGTITYQKKPPLMTAFSSTWAPVPDEYSYIYNHGFLAMMMMYGSDQRFSSEDQKFVAHLLGASQGLSEDQKEMFTDGWLDRTTRSQLKALKIQQGVQARGTS